MNPLALFACAVAVPLAGVVVIQQPTRTTAPRTVLVRPVAVMDEDPPGVFFPTCTAPRWRTAPPMRT